MWEQVRTAEWGDALDVAHEYYAANVWGDTAREAKDALRTWLTSTENRLLLTDAWTADLIKRDPAVHSVVTQLADERDRARRIAVALEQEVAELTRRLAEIPRTEQCGSGGFHGPHQWSVVAIWCPGRAAEQAAQ